MFLGYIISAIKYIGTELIGSRVRVTNTILIVKFVFLALFVLENNISPGVLWNSVEGMNLSVFQPQTSYWDVENMI